MRLGHVSSLTNGTQAFQQFVATCLDFRFPGGPRGQASFWGSFLQSKVWASQPLGCHSHMQNTSDLTSSLVTLHGFIGA